MRTYAAAWLAALLLVLAGCGGSEKPAFKLTDITGATFGRELALTDHNGKSRTLADFRGKVVAIFFGYTNCPDVCPTTLSDMAAVARELGADANRLQVLFVTVDPARDTPEVLSKYVPAFNPTFLGLHGDAEATQRVAKEFKVIYQAQKTKGSGYTVDHSAGTYLFDAQGRIRLFAPYGTGAPTLLHDIRILLKQG